MRIWIRRILLFVLLLALYRAVQIGINIEPETWREISEAWDNFTEFMFADYIKLWDFYARPHLPSNIGSIVLIVLAIFVVLFITKRRGNNGGR